MSNSEREAQSFEKLVSRFVAKRKRDQDGALRGRGSEESLTTDRAYSLTPRPQPSLMGENLTCRAPTREKDILSAHGFSFQSIVGETKCSKLYKVLDRRSGKSKAVKVYVIENAAFIAPQFVSAIKNEIATLSQIQHENIIRMYNNFQYCSKHYIVMDFMEKGSLEDYMKEHRLFPLPRERKSIFRQMLSAIKYCHDRNITHHDLKLTNVLLDKNNNIKLCGFGWCLPWATENGEISYSTDYGGDIDYAAPEVLARVPYDPRAVDVWALGVILYALLCFELPFGSINTNPHRLLKYQKSRKLRKRIMRKAPPEETPCIQVILEMLEPDVTQRISLGSIFSCDWLAEESTDKAESPPKQGAQVEDSQGELYGIFEE